MAFSWAAGGQSPHRPLCALRGPRIGLKSSEMNSADFKILPPAKCLCAGLPAEKRGLPFLLLLRRLQGLRLGDGLLLGCRRAVAPQAAVRPAGTPHWTQIVRNEFGRFQDFASGKMLVRRTPGGETQTAFLTSLPPPAGPSPRRWPSPGLPAGSPRSGRSGR